MENQTINSTSNIHPKSTNYFFDWVISNYLPSCIIYSTERVKQTINKNNLTPSQFLRPFGNFSGTNITFSVGDKFTINLKNFKFDFYDSENFIQFSNNRMTEVIENLLLTSKNTPEWSLQNISNLSKGGKSYIEPFFLNIKNYSYPWYQEYEKTILESLQFNEYEMYQQPFANIYICSIKDEKDEIEMLKKKDTMPLLMQEGILENKIPSMILVLNDKSKDTNITNDFIFKKLELIRSFNLNSYVVCLDINTNSNSFSSDINTSANNDIWSKYFHKLEIYLNSIEKNSSEGSEKITKTYGALISLEERENFKSTLLKFFNDYIKHHLQRLVVDLDDEITSNKKGIKNGFLSIFKKSEKIEYVPVYKIYKLTTMEKKLYLLSLIQFYFRDYENAMEHLKILMNDIKSKSPEHFNSIYELYTVCHFICATGSKKDVDIESAYNNYLKAKNSKNKSRAMIIQIKMLEHLKRFAEIPKILIRATGDLATPYITPIFLEKASIYFLLNNQQIRKFLLYQVLSAMAFKNSSADFKKYSLNCIGNIVPFFEINSPSFLRIKEFVNSNMGEICMNIEYFEGALKFYKNSLELSTVKSVDQDQALYIRHFLKSFNSIKHGGGSSSVDVNSFKIPEIVNSTLLVIEEQDHEIANVKNSKPDEVNLNDGSLNWINFFKYSKVELNKTYLSLSENDVLVLKNLDNIIENKQNFSTYSSKRNFTANANNKIYVRFLIKNPLNLNMSISSMKLDCEFVVDKSLNELKINPQDLIEYEEKSLLLEKNSSSVVTIYCIPKYPGTVKIKGLEIGLYKIAYFNHSFLKRNVSELYEDHSRSKSHSARSSASSNTESLKKFNHSHSNQIFSTNKEISFSIIDDNQDIKIYFPKGKEICLFTNEIYLLPIRIKNNSNIRIKKFCLYFNDENNRTEEDLAGFNKKRMGNKSNFQTNLLTHVIYKENEIKKDNECEVLIPICPQKQGEFTIKVLVKFEEESKYRDMEIRRFIIKLNVKPSVKFNLNEEIVYYNSTSTHFNLNVNAFIENRDRLSSLKIEDIYYHERYMLNDEYNWKMLENDNYIKLYTVLKMIKAKSNKSNSGNPNLLRSLTASRMADKLSEKIKENYGSISTSRSLSSEITENFSNFEISDSKQEKKFKFLPDLISESNNQHIKEKFDNLLLKDKLLFHFTVQDSRNEDRIVNGLFIYDNIIKIPQINKNFLKTIFVNSIVVNITQVSNYLQDGTSMIVIDILLDKKGLAEIPDIHYYEVYVNDEEFDFNWIGSTRYKFFNKKNEKTCDVKDNLNFCLLTNKKGIIEMNKICVSIYPKNPNEKTFVLSNVLRSKAIEID